MKKEIPNCEFKKQLIEMGFVEKKNIQNTKQVINEYKEYKKNIPKNIIKKANAFKSFDFDLSNNIIIAPYYQSNFNNSIEEKENTEENKYSQYSDDSNSGCNNYCCNKYNKYLLNKKFHLHQNQKMKVILITTISMKIKHLIKN